MNKTILTDTCFWLGLVDPTDQFHESSNTIAELIQEYNIILPWPCLYETISTHLTRRRDRLIEFEKMIHKQNITFLDDTEYKIEALKQVFEFNRVNGFTYSLTDSVIREILKDINIKISYLVTFNAPDFKDICDVRSVEIINE